MLVFVSYSLRDHNITKDHLIVLRKAIGGASPGISMYIDIFDNPEGYKCAKKTLNCPAHKHVIHKLNQADIFLLLSDESSSPWVMRELQHANEFNIPILRLAREKLNALLDDCEKKRLPVICELQRDIYKLSKNDNRPCPPIA